MKTVIGVDPGLKGGITFLTVDGGNHAADCYDMPIRDDGEIDTEHIFKMIGIADVVYIEQAQAMPKQGVVGVFTYGYGFGKVVAAFELHKMKIKFVRPAVWKKKMKLGRDKSSSVSLAEKLLPGHVFKTKRGRMLDGQAESALIAIYGMMEEVGNVQKTVN